MRLRLRAAAFLALVFAGITCSESATGPSSASMAPARVSMVPEFSAEAARAYGVLAAAGTDITEIHIVLTGPGGATRDTVVSFPVGVDVATIEIDVPPGSDGQPFTALIELRSADHTVLFSGTRVLIARASSFPRTKPPLVTINYTGPGRTIRTVTVSPRDTVVAGTPTIAYSAAAVDSAGAPVANLLVGWTSSDGTVATATPTGNATASVLALGKRGSSTISARTPLGVTGRSVLTVVPPAARLVVISGGGQSGPGGSQLPLPFIVEAQAADNLPVPGTSITFRSVTAGGSVSQVLPRIADAAGRASTLMTLGTAAGSYQYEAAATGLVPVSVNQTALAGAATNIAIFSGNLQSEIVGRALPLPLVVQVTDQFGSPVAGATVTWARASGNGTVSAASTTTVGNGTASITYTLGAAPGGEVIIATLNGGGSVQFGATANVIGAGSIVVVSGGGQAGIPNSLLAAPLVVRVNDAGGNPLTGQLVTFTSTGATFTPTSFTTGANGLATTQVTLGATPGPVTLTATSGTLTVSTGATITAGPAASIAKVAGDLQSAIVGSAVAIAPSVVVKDAGGNPVPNAPVVFAVASGGGTATGLTVNTNAQGVATVGSWTLGSTAGANTLTATTGALSTTFSATAVAGTGSILVIGPSPSATTPSGVAFVRQPAVQLRDANNNDVQTAGVVITATVTSGTATLTNATATTGPTGLATFTALTATGPLGNVVITFSAAGYAPVPVGPIVIVAGSPSTIALSAGSNQTAAVGTAVAIPPAVLVTDAGGNPVAGANVVFGVITAGAQISNGTTTGTTLTVVTNGSGIATLASWTLGSTAQSYILNATATGLSGSPVVFTATAVAGTGSQLTLAVQPPSTATIGVALVPQPVIQLKDALGNNAATPGVVVNALISQGGTLVNASATTNAAGLATFTGLGFTGATGNFTLQFGATGFTNLPFGTIAVSAGSPSAIALSAGNNQSATVGTAVPVAPAVLVTDASGNPVAGTVVTFATVTGGSTVSNGSTTGPTVTVTTNGSGIAALAAWTLGAQTGPYAMNASATGLTGSPVAFTATAVPGTGSVLAFLVTPATSAVNGAPLAQQPVIQLKDALGNDVTTAGVTVVAQITGGTGSLGNASAVTTANGRASFSGLVISGAVGSFSLQFSAAGYTALPFSPIALSVGAPTTLAVSGGNNQTSTVGTAVPIPPAVAVTDLTGNPVPGVTVTFSVVTAGSTVSNGATTGTTVTVATNGSGVATLTAWTLGNVAQAYTMTGAVSGLTGSPVTFTGTALAGPGAVLALTQQPSSSTTSGAALAVQPVVQLRDVFGNNVASAGVLITASITNGTGSLTNATALTNGAGVATFSGLAITGGAGAVTLQFSSTGYTGASFGPITVVAASPAALVFATAWNPGTTPALTIFSPAPSVQVVDGSGNPVRQAGITVVVNIASGPTPPTPFLVSNVASTNSLGIATFAGLTLGGATGTYTLSFGSSGLTPVVSGNVVITNGTGTVLAITAGNAQTAAVTTAVAISPTVLLTDGSGNPVPNQTVTFTVLAAGSVISNGSTSSSTSVPVQTNGSGLAILTSWILGPVARPYSLSASFPGAANVNFGANAVAGPAASIALNAGDNQSGPAGFSLPIPPSVVVRDAQGNGVGGVVVQFTVVTAGATLSNGATTSTTVPVTTNPQSGIAQLNAWTLGPVAQVYTMNATLSGVTGSPVTFTANGTASAASSIIVNAGNNQSATVGTAVATPPSVLVRDPNGNPVQGTVVTFNVVTAGAQIANGATTGTTLTVTTGSNGIAALTSWTMGPLAQQYLLTADAPGLVGTPVTFTATAVAGPAAILVMQAGNNQSALPGAAVAIPPAVRVLDANSNGVAGIVVTFSPVTPGALLQNASTSSTGPLTVTTNAQGVAALTNFFVGNTAQQYTLTAAVSGLPGSPVTFIETAVPGPATHMSYITVPSASAQASTALPVQPVIQLRDAPGNAVPQQGVVIVATVTSGSATLANATATTDATGKATFSGLALSGLVGPYTLGFADQAASLAGLSHNLTLTPGSPSRVAVTVAGSNTAVDGVALATAPQVQVRDASGNNVPQAGITILATITSGPSGSLTNATATTNGSGTASFTGLTITGIIGTYNLGISSTGLTGTALAPISVTIGAPSAIVASSGTGQTATGGEAVPIAPAFRVVDAGNNGIAGQSVLFNTVPAGSQITNAGTCCNNLTVVTNANGVATLVSWTLSSTPGTNTLNGSVPNTPAIGSATITATGVASNSNSLSFINRPGTPTTSGALLSPQPSFQIRNVQGAPVAIANVPVTAYIVVGSSGSATLTGTTTVLTNASGIATFTNLVATGPSGSFSLRFSSPGYAGTLIGMSFP